jgi:hypothetical protein
MYFFAGIPFMTESQVSIPTGKTEEFKVFHVSSIFVKNTKEIKTW